MEDKRGVMLVSLARRAVELFLKDGILLKPEDNPALQEKKGVFVSIYVYPLKELRGCIGFPYPQMPLGEATVRAAIAAAVEDPRFPPLRYEELPKVVFEVSVLTRPEEVDTASRKDLPNMIRVGVDGLIIETPYGSCLLLPQVPVMYGWDAEEYLSHLCVKAGLNPTYWLHGKMRLLRYTAEVFAEQSPGGKVTRSQLV
ncbi:MAG: TIGR00296 family protein [Candidatus Caldarchaeum sp.]